MHVTLVATPDTQVAPLSGLFEALTCFDLLHQFEPDIPERPFAVDVVTEPGAPACGYGDLVLRTTRPCEAVDRTDVAVVPLMAVAGPEWVSGRHPRVVTWLRRQHEGGALLASACTGVLLLAETGLLDGREATIHWAFAPTLRRSFPQVRVRPRETLVTCGDDLVMTGGVMSWHDLALHLIARYVGADAARAAARMLMLEWHGRGQAPYVSFVPPRDHSDALVAQMQDWLEDHVADPRPVEALCAGSGLGARTLERRFVASTGLTPLAYVQQLRIQHARRLLERTVLSVEEVGFRVGYQNTSFFRRLFRRQTQLAPAAYRRRFQLPED